MTAWVAQRQATLVSVFLAYLLNFSLQYIARKSKHERTSQRIRQCHKKVFLFGFVSLISCNLLQSGIVQAVVSWAILISLGVVHFVNFKQIQPKKRAITHLIFYFLLAASPIVSAVHYILP